MAVFTPNLLKIRLPEEIVFSQLFELLPEFEPGWVLRSVESIFRVPTALGTLVWAVFALTSEGPPTLVRLALCVAFVFGHSLSVFWIASWGLTPIHVWLG